MLPNIYTIKFNKDNFGGEEMTSFYLTDKTVNKGAVNKFVKDDILLIVSFGYQKGMLMGVGIVEEVCKEEIIDRYGFARTYPQVFVSIMMDVRDMNIQGLVSNKRYHDVVDMFDMNYMRYPVNFHNSLSSILNSILPHNKYVSLIDSERYNVWYDELSIV